jgi:hypothetical protein
MSKPTAVANLIESQGKKMLRERLKREAIANAQRDIELAAEWFPAREEAAAVAARAPTKGPSKARKAKTK